MLFRYRITRLWNARRLCRRRHRRIDIYAVDGAIVVVDGRTNVSVCNKQLIPPNQAEKI